MKKLKRPAMPGAGRPRIGAEPMRRCQVMLDADTIIRAETLGNGNLSAGLREAVRQVHASKAVGSRARLFSRRADDGL